MSDDANTPRERMEAIAYMALWEIRDEDPDAEPPEYRAARIKLRKTLDGYRGGKPATTTLSKHRSSGGRRGREHLSVVAP